MNAIPFEQFSIVKTMFKQVVADVSYIDDFEIEVASQQLKQSIITLYDTHTDTKTLLKKIGIDIMSSRILDNQTVFLDENQLKLLVEKAPYLVSMATVDLAELSPADFINQCQQNTLYIQFENDVIFVVAGTNKPNSEVEKIGSPADSINSMVVNAVTKRGLSTRYARKGLALSFFAKPDVSYYGGSEEQYIKVCEPLGEANVAGTSFAAPWIARKLSYLIDVLGLNREVAKAMIIDAARDWNEKPAPEEVALYGHGIVPVKIGDIVQTKDDEIKFLLSDVSEKWNTYNYHFPVPIKDDKYPYIARATMCYFPKCNRTQGVDYTNTELNLHFGRINKGKICDIKGG